MRSAFSLSGRHGPRGSGRLIRPTAVIALFLLLGTASAALASSPDVVFVAPSTAAPYGPVIEAFNEQIETICKTSPARCPRGGPVSRTTTPEDSELGRLDPDNSLLVPLGGESARRVADLNWRGRTIYALIPSDTYVDLADCCLEAKDRQTALFLDHPPDRVIGLARALLPDMKRMALLTSPASESAEPQYASRAQKLGLSLEIARARSAEEVGPALKTLLDAAEVLIAVPDQTLYNSETIYGVLLTTYRNRVPVIGFSAPLVKAGALAAVYTSPEDIGRELATMVIDQLENPRRSLPSARHPQRFSVTTNRQVGRSLGIELPADEALKRKLEGMQ